MKRIIAILAFIALLLGCNKPPKPTPVNNNRTVVLGDTFSIKIQECILLKLDTLANINCVVCLDSIKDNRCLWGENVDECWGYDSSRKAILFLRILYQNKTLYLTPATLLNFFDYNCITGKCNAGFEDTLVIGNKRWYVSCCNVYPYLGPRPALITSPGKYFATIKFDEL